MDTCDYIETYDHGRLLLRFRKWRSSRGLKQQCLVIDTTSDETLWSGHNKEDGLRLIAKNELLPFLPYPDLTDSVTVLKNDDLIQTYMTLRVIRSVRLMVASGWWDTHPAVEMLRPHFRFLQHWQSAIQNRLMAVNMTAKAPARLGYWDEIRDADPEAPWWLTWDVLHYTHQSHLVGRDPKYYGGIFQVSPGVSLAWPEGS